MAYQGELRQSDAVLKAFFVRRGRHGEADYDFLQDTGGQSLCLERGAQRPAPSAPWPGNCSPLRWRARRRWQRFVAAAPSSPDFADVCVQKVEEMRERNPVHVAQGPAAGSGQ